MNAAIIDGHQQIIQVQRQKVVRQSTLSDIESLSTTV